MKTKFSMNEVSSLQRELEEAYNNLDSALELNQQNTDAFGRYVSLDAINLKVASATLMAVCSEIKKLKPYKEKI